MIENGEYVFINIDIFGSIQTQAKPWFVENDTPDNNELAKDAYTSLLTVSTRQPDDEAYLEFSGKVVFYYFFLLFLTVHFLTNIQ